jgi:hypothetical protein
MTDERAKPVLLERPLLWAVPLAVAIALAGTAGMIFREDVRRLYEANGDIQSILRYAGEARTGDVLSWWTGVWIEQDSFYYRPLASILMYAEYRAFSGAWRPFCIVSWLMHAAICALIVLFLARLFGHWAPHLRVLPGLLAVAWFSIPCETTVDGPHWGNRGIARGLMPYWPAQTDLGCLLLSLLSLLLWDRWLEGGRRKTLVGAIVAFVAALLFKEHAVVVPLLAVAIALYRKRSPKFTALAGGVGIVASGLFLVLRGLLAPGAWGPDYKGLGHLMLEVMMYLCEPTLVARLNGHDWLTLSGALVSVCVGLAVYRPRRLYLHAFGAFLAVFLPPQLLAGNIALPTLPEFAWLLVRITVTFVLPLLASEQRTRGPSLALLGCLLAVHLPILHVIGPHYYYWPVAWWSILNATAIVGLPGTLRAAKARVPTASPAAEEAPAEG